MMKRSMSDASDGEDGFSCDDSKSQEDGDPCQLQSRKKRRGIIEKRRRDRINNSLSELRRLVPAAFEKQGSAKLEKAEILQMTVDHLKMLHTKGLDALAYDPHKIAMDYHSIGFRECAAEVARYLVAVEGMDIQDPLRLRLMSHLQCFSAQRDLASKQPSNPWSFPTPPPVPPPPPPPPTHPPPPAPPNHHHHHHHPNMYPSGQGPLGQAGSYPGPGMSHVESSAFVTPSDNNNYGMSPRPQTSSPTQQYHLSFGSNYGSGNPPSYGQKPYRPWGAELAY